MRTISGGLLVLCIICGTGLLQSQTISREPLSPRNANYTIDVRLDTKSKMIFGDEILRWTNITNDRISELQFHLYLNGFRNSESTFMKESGGMNRGQSGGDDPWGWTEVLTMVHPKDGDLLENAEFIAPDDGNEKDMTVLRVPLETPVRPGETIELVITFEAKLPRVFARTGYAGNFFMVAQWFPKIGVYEPQGMRGREEGGWNCHQFHSNTEFYADYGVYEVSMTVPKDNVLGASGLLLTAEDIGDTATTYTYRAEDVHDFSWTCSPDFEVFEETWEHVNIRLLIQPEHVDSKRDRYFASAIGSLEYFDAWLGVYPYTTLTIVDPPVYALGAGGMEYPTLITGLSVKYLPSGLREVENVTIHEFGHEYFYGLIGNNEFEEAWMDEGFNQYAETRIMDHLYGDGRSVMDVLGFTIGDVENARAGYLGMSEPRIDPIDTYAWKFDAGGYGSLTYAKTATVMHTLQGIIGTTVMDEAVKTYFERWRFRHPTREDFEAVVNEVVRKHHGDRFGENMDWFFEQAIGSSVICDYEIMSMNSTEIRPPRGKDSEDMPRDSVTQFRTRVGVLRSGEMQLPVDVLMVFENGDSLRTEWDGKTRYKIFTEVRNDRIVYAEVDPDRKIMLDANVLNNAMAESVPSRTIWKYAIKFLFWLQNVAQISAVL